MITIEEVYKRMNQITLELKDLVKEVQKLNESSNNYSSNYSTDSSVKPYGNPIELNNKLYNFIQNCTQTIPLCNRTEDVDEIKEFRERAKLIKGMNYSEDKVNKFVELKFNWKMFLIETKDFRKKRSRKK